MTRVSFPRSLDSRRVWRSGGGRSRREQGVALVMVMAAVAILAVLLTDMQETASTAFVVASTERDQLKAEYLAKSALNLTRLLVAKEPQIRQTVAPLYQLALHRAPPQVPVWRYATEILRPYCNYSAAVRSAAGSGIDLTRAEGIGETGGECTVTAFAENSKLNVNDPLSLDGNPARSNVAMQLFALMGGYQSPSPYDAIFDHRDPDGQVTTRLDIVSAIVDWWDIDEDRTVYDPSTAQVTSAGREDDVYQLFRDPYRVKNAPFDSIEELRLARGVGDDFWATFIEPNLDDPDSRAVTIYGSGAVNPNEASPEVLLARACAILADQPLCSDPLEAAKFIQLVKTARAILPVPWFTRVSDFLSFLEGRGGQYDLYPLLKGLLGEDNPLLFQSVSIASERRSVLDAAFVTAARILTIEATGTVGRSRTRIRTVVNFHDRWTPPPPNAGTMPGLGIFHYYRIE